MSRFPILGLNAIGWWWWCCGEGEGGEGGGVRKQKHANQQSHNELCTGTDPLHLVDQSRTARGQRWTRSLIVQVSLRLRRARRWLADIQRPIREATIGDCKYVPFFFEVSKRDSSSCSWKSVTVYSLDTNWLRFFSFQLSEFVGNLMLNGRIWQAHQLLSTRFFLQVETVEVANRFLCFETGTWREGRFYRIKLQFK